MYCGSGDQPENEATKVRKTYNSVLRHGVADVMSKAQYVVSGIVHEGRHVLVALLVDQGRLKKKWNMFTTRSNLHRGAIGTHQSVHQTWGPESRQQSPLQK
jgi:hypothetical protein